VPIRELFGPRPAVTQTQFVLLDSLAQLEEMISALPDPVYVRDFNRPWIRDGRTSDREKRRYSQQQWPIVAAGDGVWKPEYERRMKMEGEKRNGES
jgi:hypothetical protein